MRQLNYLILFLCMAFIPVQGQELNLVDINSTENTKELYRFLWEVQDNDQTLFGHHDALAYGHGWRDSLGYSDVYSMVGDHPAVCSMDFGKIEHNNDLNINRIPFDKMREIAKYAHERGQIITFCWHVDNPKTYSKNASYPVGTSWDNSDNTVVKEILTENSEVNILFKSWMDNLANYIYTLKDDNDEPIPFIFRPWHEHTQVWNWWGAKCATDQEFIDLWRFTVNYLRDVKGIHNIIYAISPQMDEVYEDTESRLIFRWPGDKYVDFIGMDCYHGRNHAALESNLEALSKLSQKKRKPFGITEMGVESVTYNKYFTKEVLPYITNYNPSLFIFWRNDDVSKDHHFLPFKGHSAESDFIEFSKSENILFESDLSGYLMQYSRGDFDVELVSKFSNPYFQEDVMVNMQIVAPSGEKITLPCYFESGESGKTTLWKARFTPVEIGDYSYYFELSGGKNKRSFTKQEQFKVLRSERSGFLRSKSNWALQFDNGVPFRGIGENICWESRDEDDSKFFKDLHERADVYNYDYMLSELARCGGNFYRVWICSWNLPIDYKGPFNNSRYEISDEYYNPSALKRMDYLVDLSESHDLYMMLTLGQGGYTTQDRGVVNSSEDFFASSEARKWYKNRLRYIVARWGYSPSIAMWEFFNEVDNVQFRDSDNPIDGRLIVDWHEEMSAYLKEIDPYGHIITTSISHRDIDGLNSIENIDINQKHIYNNTEIIPDDIMKYVSEFEKPYIIGEFGREWDWSKNFDDFSHEMDIDFKRGLWYGIFSPTPVAPLSWWWEYFDARRMKPYFSGVREISDRMLEAGKGDFESINVDAGDLEAFGVKCGNEVYVYLFNPNNEITMTDVSIELTNFNEEYKGVSFEPTMKVYNEVRDIENSDENVIIKNEILGSECEIVYIITLK